MLSRSPWLDRVGTGTTRLDGQLLINHSVGTAIRRNPFDVFMKVVRPLIMSSVEWRMRPDQIRIDFVLFLPTRCDALRASALLASNEWDAGSKTTWERSGKRPTDGDLVLTRRPSRFSFE